MKNITVIHFVHTLYGGVASVAANLVNHQRDIGYKTVVAYVNYSEAFDSMLEYPCEKISVEMSGFPGRSMMFGMDIAKVYKEYKNSHKDEFVICHVHNVQTLGAFGNWKNIPIICTLHSLNGKARTLRKKISNYLYKISLEKLLKHKKVITSVSRAIVDEYANTSQASEITVIPNGTDVDANRRQKNEKGFVIGHVGNLSYAKGWDTVMDAYLMLPKDIQKNIFVYSAGKDESFSKAEIEDKARVLGIEGQIVCKGFVNNAKDNFINGLDILVLPSRNEGFGLVLIEAMGYGIPVLARNTGGICEVLIDGYNGFMIKDAHDLSERIQELFTNRELYSQLSNNAIDSYNSKFNLNIINKKYDQLYKRVIEGDSNVKTVY